VLTSLAIRNFVLIEDAVVDFGPGLTALTGETGAGKTLLTQALELLLGERAADGLVGPGGEEALIQAVFELSPDAVGLIPEEVLELTGIEPGELIATRRLHRSGRNRAYLNDSAVNLTVLARALGGLVAFSGQHEHRRLLEPAYQRTVLDAFAGEQASGLLAAYHAAWTSARAAEALLREGGRSTEERRRERELLAFQVDELEAAGLSGVEEEELGRQQELLSRAEEVARLTAEAASLLRSPADETDVGALLSLARSRLAGLRGLDTGLDEAARSLEEAAYLIDDSARQLRATAETTELDPARLAEIEGRLRLYLDLGRKYGGSTDAAVAFLENGRRLLAELHAVDEDLTQARLRRDQAAAEASSLAARLSETRRLTAPALENAIAAQLGDLGMTDTRVAVEVRTAPSWESLGPTGADTVALLFAANPGLPLRPLARTASGGELSRTLLAIKGALVGLERAETLVFDEVDAGIGGRTATAVGRKLRHIAGDNQLLVVTHLAQVAAFADHQVRIEKAVGDFPNGAQAPEEDPAAATLGQTTVTRLVPLDEEGSLLELARMLGGRPGDPEALAHARVLRDRALGGLLD
jgi:DNA repair protein RecN (Recombination protein N)